MSDVWTGLRWVSFALCALVLSACSETEFLVHSAKRMSDIVSDPAEPGFKIGQPYQIQGVWYYPAEITNSTKPASRHGMGLSSMAGEPPTAKSTT